mmetsp:Transcript_30031/g.64831  ORF Transcript_30031/g.64831 Transcript_30031/m.64831 type:complete len:93 (+) Transcript_30031:432-710(+)
MVTPTVTPADARGSASGDFDVAGPTAPVGAVPTLVLDVHSDDQERSAASPSKMRISATCPLVAEEMHYCGSGDSLTSAHSQLRLEFVSRLGL